MRSKNDIRGKKIIKKVHCSPLLGESILAKMEDYVKSLETIGICSPPTKTEYLNRVGVLKFTQQIIRNDGDEFPHQQIIRALKNYDWKYGIDSNPNNFFFCRGNIFNVDFFPFLTREKSLLKEQFNYPVKMVLRRYFSAPNTIVSYIIRLYKEKPREAKGITICNAGYIIKNYQEILPREKLRLYTAIRLFNKNKTDCFSEFYKNSKEVSSIDEALNKKLYKILVNIS